MKVVIYKVIHENDSKLVAVVAPNTTVASEMIRVNFQNHSIHFQGVCDHVVQLNGQVDLTVATI
jgi:hypothetical protein